MIASVVIRQAEAGDAAAIASLLQAAGLPAGIATGTVPWFSIALEGDEAVGTVAVEPCGGFGLLRSLAVHADRRGAGIGCSLVAECEARADAARLRGLYLLTTTARHFFRARGYDDLEHWELPEVIRDTAEYRTQSARGAVALMKRLR
ncbi:MAG TPA: GNAT family N-acetyltransferase [Burkholderiales bacterium]|nr:GNAT family N-acetyltransferase [Burkholderiales bacterium]